MFRNQPNAPARPGGAEYGVQPPSMRPAPAPGSAARDVALQLDGLLDGTRDGFAPPAPVPSNPNEVVLSKAYRAHDEVLTRFTLRRPVAREIKHCGSPIRVITGADGRIQDMEIKWDVVTKYVPLLSSPPIPPSTVDEFDYFDLDSCAAVLAGFFVRLAPSGT